MWARQNLLAIRFSGGEPLLYKGLNGLVKCAKYCGIKRIAVSSNGSLPTDRYLELINDGVNDFSISLDACCAADANEMSGGVGRAWDQIAKNIEAISKVCYLTVGVVLTEYNAPKVSEIVEYANGLGVSDIRIIPAAQVDKKLSDVIVSDEVLDKYPILKYRIDNVRNGKSVRSLNNTDSNRCGLCLDDMLVCGEYHYPCVIHFREGGAAIGKITDSDDKVRNDRLKWFFDHDTHKDEICSNNCLDVCVDYNNCFRDKNKKYGKNWKE